MFHMVWILGGIPSKDIFKWSYDADLNYSESTEFYIHSLMSINKHRKCMKEFSKISYESFLSYFGILVYFILFAGSPWDRNYKQGSVKVVWKPWFCERQTIV